MLKQSFNLFKLAAKHNQSVKYNLIITIVLELVAILGLYFLNKQYGVIYDGIQAYKTAQIWAGIAYFSAIAGGLVVVGGILTYYANKLAFSIREGLTDYYVENIHRVLHVENYEQRLQEDLRNFGEKSCDFWLAVFRSACKLPVFVGVIVNLTHWHIGVIIVVSVIAGTILTKIVANKLIKLQAEQESNEASFRSALSTKGQLAPIFSFSFIRFKFIEINKQVKKLSFVQSGLGQGFVLLPFILLMPLYLSKVMNMGQFMQSVNALSRVIDSLTVLIDNRQLIVNISTCLERMKKL